MSSRVRHTMSSSRQERAICAGYALLSRDRELLQRTPLSGAGFLYVSTDFVQQLPSRDGNSNFAAQNFMPVHVVAIHGLVSAFVGLDDSAIQAYPCEDTFRA